MLDAVLPERMLACGGCCALFRALRETIGEGLPSFIAVTQNASHSGLCPQAGVVSVAEDSIDYATPGPDDAIGELPDYQHFANVIAREEEFD